MQACTTALNDTDGACLAAITVVAPTDLTPPELERLSELTTWGDSDLNRLLKDIHAGDTENTHISLAKIGGRIVGWAASEVWRYLVLMNCYVDEDLRDQGIGTALVRALIPIYKGTYQHQPYVDLKAKAFYTRAAPELFALPKAKRTP